MSGFISTPTMQDIEAAARASAELQATVQELKNRIERLERSVRSLQKWTRLDFYQDEHGVLAETRRAAPDTSWVGMVPLKDAHKEPALDAHKEAKRGLSQSPDAIQ